MFRMIGIVSLLLIAIEFPGPLAHAGELDTAVSVINSASLIGDGNAKRDSITAYTPAADVAQSPILDKVVLRSGRYFLRGHMPAASAVPAGGYKTIVNGSPLTDVSPQINRTLRHLDTSVSNCFQIDSRWTQFTPTQFRSSNEMCVHALAATAPILDRVKLSGGKYSLIARMPAGAAMPAGGFKSVVDNVAQNDISHRLTRTVSGLETSTQHCFRVEARWTDFSPTLFRGSNEICHAGDSVTAEKPILRKSDIQFDSGRYRVAARMPNRASIPDGGYRLVVNGVLRQGAVRELSWTLNDLDPSIQQCFQVRALWNQLSPRRTKASAKRCVGPIQDAGATLVFDSGFESGVALSTDKTDLLGADSSAYDWQHDLEALPYVSGYSNNFVDGVEGQHFKVDLLSDPVDPNNRVLALENIEIVGSPHSRPQGTLGFRYDNADPSVSIYEFSVAVDMYLEHGFAYAETLSEAIGQNGYWFDFFEIWENNGNDNFYDVAGRSRITVHLEKDAGSNKPFYFHVSSEITPKHDPFQTQWSRNNRDVEVPIGRWFTLKAYFKAGGPDSGRFRLNVVDNGTEKTVFDVFDTTRNNAEPTAPSALQAKKNYASENLMDLLQSHGQSLLIYYDNYRLYEGELK